MKSYRVCVTFAVPEIPLENVCLFFTLFLLVTCDILWFNNHKMTNEITLLIVSEKDLMSLYAQS